MYSDLSTWNLNKYKLFLLTSFVSHSSFNRIYYKFVSGYNIYLYKEVQYVILMVR